MLTKKEHEPNYLLDILFSVSFSHLWFINMYIYIIHYDCDYLPFLLHLRIFTNLHHIFEYLLSLIFQNLRNFDWIFYSCTWNFNFTAT